MCALLVIGFWLVVTVSLGALFYMTKSWLMRSCFVVGAAIYTSFAVVQGFSTRNCFDQGDMQLFRAVPLFGAILLIFCSGFFATRAHTFQD